MWGVLSLCPGTGVFVQLTLAGMLITDSESKWFFEKRMNGPLRKEGSHRKYIMFIQLSTVCWYLKNLCPMYRKNDKNNYVVRRTILWIIWRIMLSFLINIFNEINIFYLIFKLLRIKYCFSKQEKDFLNFRSRPRWSN